MKTLYEIIWLILGCIMLACAIPVLGLISMILKFKDGIRFDDDRASL